MYSACLVQEGCSCLVCRSSRGARAFPFSIPIDAGIPLVRLARAPQVANLIRRDGIDILIELTGHTAGNRLDVMVQASRAGLPAWHL